MSRPIGSSNNTPSYCLHKASGRAYCTLDGKPVYLGQYGTQESRQRYDRAIGEWLANGRKSAPTPTPTNPTTVATVLAAFLRHAQEYHRNADGTAAGELDNFKCAMRPLRKLYAAAPVMEFGPIQMKAVRREMVQLGWCRNVVNRQLGRLRHIFNWAAGEALIPAAIADAVGKVKGLRFGKSEARESEPVEPVANDVLQATLPHLSPHIRAMVELQLVTGVRPDEIFRMKNGDIDTSKDGLWHYCPAQHKTAHHGVKRSVPLGPKAQEILAPYRKLDATAYIFCPIDAEADRHARQRDARQTPVQPSQARRGERARRRIRRRGPGRHYTRASYRRAIVRACDVAFPPPEPLARMGNESKAAWMARLTAEQKTELKSWRKSHRWHPHQLRHNAATLIRELYGLEAAQAILGHKTIAITQIYAQRNLKAAEKVMSQVG
jgi:integrase